MANCLVSTITTEHLLSLIDSALELGGKTCPVSIILGQMKCVLSEMDIDGQRKPILSLSDTDEEVTMTVNSIVTTLGHIKVLELQHDKALAERLKT